MEKISDLEIAVDAIIKKLGNTIVLGAPLGAGKPNHLINAIYQRAKSNKEIDLTICTALTLERPKPKSDLEKRFLGPFEKRVFADYPDLDYELDRTNNQLPKNIKVIEFYFPPGKYLNNPKSQQNYISSNYTHVCRDMIDRDINLLVQMVCKQDDKISFSCNADVSSDMIPLMRKKDSPSLLIGQINQNLPFMYGDAVVDQDLFDIIIDRPQDYYQVFGPPKMSITDADFMIGLHAAALVKDDGELQVGIGSLGDAVIYGLILREKDNGIFKTVLEKTNFLNNYKYLIDRIGGLNPFHIGLYGATEMMVDGFMELYENNILKKTVYGNLPLQRLINANLLDPNQISENILDYLTEQNTIHSILTLADFNFLVHWGIFKDDLSFKNGTVILPNGDYIDPNLTNQDSKNKIIKYCLGEKLKHGRLMHAGFFLGPQKFYKWLNDLTSEKRKLFEMRSVLKVNQLYGHEEIDRLHRKNARFINTCMMTTLSGAHVSDGIEDGRVVSGVGGQFNFVAMAQELPDGHSVITMRSTRTKKGKTYSNIVNNYGHITVPRHMRDILVTEYGVAFLRGKTDQEIIIELLKVSDSRFQEELMNHAKKTGKLSNSYQLPKEFKNNLPSKYSAILEENRKSGFFERFPFGTDLTPEEIKIGGALKRLKAKMEKPLLQKIQFLLTAIFSPVTNDQLKHLVRIDLNNPRNTKEKIYQKLVAKVL